jgi:hypothetical protein
MVRKPATMAGRRSGPTAAGSMACLAFVILMAVAFWAGILWIAESLTHVSAWW